MIVADGEKEGARCGPSQHRSMEHFELSHFFMFLDRTGTRTGTVQVYIVSLRRLSRRSKCTPPHATPTQPSPTQPNPTRPTKMPTLMTASTSIPPAAPFVAPVPTSLTLSFHGVQFELRPADASAQVSYQTNAQGRIVLDLSSFTGSLEIAASAPAPAQTTSPTNTHKSATAKVEEEPNSPIINNPENLATVTPGQQKLTFHKKNKDQEPKSKEKEQPRKRLSGGPKASSKKPRKEEAQVHARVRVAFESTSNKTPEFCQQTMEIPTQDGIPDFSQTMPTGPSVSGPSSTSSQEGKFADEMIIHETQDDSNPKGETVREILDRVNSSNDSVANDIEEHDPSNASSLMLQEVQDANMQEATAETAVEDFNPSVTTSSNYLAPCARWGHTMTKLKEGRLLVYGGESFDKNGNPFILSDVHVYNTQKRTWDKPINCRGESRRWHSSTFLPERQLLLAFGGETTDIHGKNKNKVITSDSLKVLDTEIMLWYPPAVSGDTPTGRSGHSATLIPSTNEVVLFGGVKGSKWLNTVTILDTVRWIWTAPKIIGSAPKPRSYHSATAVKIGDHHKLVIFGGNNKTSCFNTVHVLEMTTSGENETCWKWSHPSVQGQAPFPRTGHSATLLEDGKTICIYGGWDPNDATESGEENIFQSSFLLDTEVWSWSIGPKTLPGGSGTEDLLADCGAKRCGHTAEINNETGEILVFGGRIPGEILAGDFQLLSNTEEK